MRSETGPISVVRSDTQRAMCRYWAKAAQDLPFPSLDRFRPRASLHDPKQLIIWNVERSAHRNAFRTLYQGALVGQVFNSAWAGKLMEDVLPPALKVIGLQAAEECASSGCAIYCVLSTYTSTGQVVECERLLLPLGTAGQVEQIVASLQLTSGKASFNRET